MSASAIRVKSVFVLLLLALGLRLAPWGHNRFLEDEALYSYWGLQIGTGADPMLDFEPVDKPPLHPYTLALSFLLFGHNETAARLPSLLASIASIALVYALGRALYGDARTGLWAALLLVLSPFDLLFASTAFTDPLLTALLLAALPAAARGRLGAAGLLAGLTAATKQQGLLFLPLIVAVGLLSARHERARPKSLNPKRSAWLRFGLGFALVAGGVLWWDLARVQRPGFWAQGLISYGSLLPAQPATLGERTADWLWLVGAFWAAAVFNVLVLGLFALWVTGGRARWWPRPSPIDLVLAAFVASYLVLHWLLGFQVWDRYLLPLVPLVALLAARSLVTLGAAMAPKWRRAYPAIAVVVVVLLLASPVWRAAHSRLPLGGDHGAYDGIDQLAAYVRSHAPPGAVLYHHWLGYHYRFYLYGAPLRLHWYPDPADLVHDAAIYRREPRFIAFPSWRDSAPQRAALAAAGINLVPIYQTTRRDGTVSFRLYRLEGP